MRRSADTECVEPLSNPIALALKLPSLQGSNTNLSILLQDGMIVSGEVLESTNNTAYLSLGGRRVPAETAVQLRAGERFVARVQHQGDSLVLRILSEAPEPERTLVDALRGVLAEDRPAGALISRLVGDLRAQLDRAAPVERARIEALVRNLQRFVMVPDGDGRTLTQALIHSGLFHEALLLGDDEAVRTALADLKSLLLAAHAEAGDASTSTANGAAESPEREAIGHALAGLEAEQLLDVARAQSGDPRNLTVAVPDGAQLASAHLLVHPDARRESEDPEAPTSTTRAVDLAVNFTNLGAVRAEFRLDGQSLGVRFVVTNPDVAARVAADRDRLTAQLATGGLAPHLCVVHGRDDAMSSESGVEDVRFLRDHLVLDMTG